MTWPWWAAMAGYRCELALANHEYNPLTNEVLTECSCPNLTRSVIFYW
jgi:hypothetical protein